MSDDWYGLHFDAPKGRRIYVSTEPYVPVSDPNPRSPYHIPPPPVEDAQKCAPTVAMTPGAKARAWLAAELAVEPVPSLELQERAREAGITLSTLRRIAKAMGLRKIKQGRGPWCWAMPEDDCSNTARLSTL
jgi:hypothetical protein